MVAPHEAPARLMDQGLLELLEGDKTVGIEHQAELVGTVAQDVGQYFGQGFQLPGQLHEQWSVASSQLSVKSFVI